ncbi:MAG: hypothetical protein ACOCZQ_01275 [Nanoarchaeota archaeon]
MPVSNEDAGIIGEITEAAVEGFEQTNMHVNILVICRFHIMIS